jgi:hypothetical protein
VWYTPNCVGIFDKAEIDRLVKYKLHLGHYFSSYEQKRLLLLTYDYSESYDPNSILSIRECHVSVYVKVDKQRYILDVTEPKPINFGVNTNVGINWIKGFEWIRVYELEAKTLSPEEEAPLLKNWQTVM